MRTKDPGAPRNQRVWRASLTPPTTSCSNTGRALRVRIKRTKYKDEAWRLLLWTTSLLGIVIPNEALLLLPREGPERAVRMPRVWCAAISRTLGAIQIGVKLESREAAKECSPRRKPWVEYRDDASPRGAKETNPK